MRRIHQARTEPRIAVICRISVVWEDPDGSPKTQPGMLEDRSRSGVGISVKAPIPVGAKVKVGGRHRELIGVVRHCHRHEFNYLVGIQLDEADLSWASLGAGL